MSVREGKRGAEREACREGVKVSREAGYKGERGVKSEGLNDGMNVKGSAEGQEEIVGRIK